MQALQQRIHFHVNESGVALRVSFFQPFERPLGVTAVRMDARHLVRGVIAMLVDQLL